MFVRRSISTGKTGQELLSFYAFCIDVCYLTMFSLGGGGEDGGSREEGGISGHPDFNYRELS